MNKVLLKSVHDAFDYVMEHYYPFGMKEMAPKQDTYIVISIQDSHCGGFGIEFTENEFCKGVLTLHFDDIEGEVDGAVLFSDEQAERIVDFVVDYSPMVDTLLVHCYAGQSRSRAVAAVIMEMKGKSGSDFLENGSANAHVYDTLLAAWLRRLLSPTIGIN